MAMVFAFHKFLLILADWIHKLIWQRYIFPSESTKTKRLVILGGGFSGAYAAKKLEDHFQVTFIDEKDYFEFTPSVLRTLVEPNHIGSIQILHSSYLDMRKTKIVQQRVSNVQSHSLTLMNGEILEFDYLIVCTGSTYHWPFKDGANVVMATRGSSLSKCYQQVKQSEHILVIGGGIVGVELSAEILEHFPDKSISIVHAGNHLMNRGETNSKTVEYVTRHLTHNRRNVQIHLNERVVQQNGHEFSTDRGNVIEADLALVCTGIKPNSEPFTEGPLFQCVDDRGFLKVNEYLQLEGFPHIFVAGDVASLREEKLAQNAESEALTVVHNILLYAKHQAEENKLSNPNDEPRSPKFNRQNSNPIELRTYTPKSRIKIISLGKYDGITLYKNFAFTGFIPAIMKEFVEFKVMVAYRYRTKFHPPFHLEG